MISSWGYAQLAALRERPTHRTGTRILQIAFGLVALFRILTEWHFAEYLWGPHGVGQGSAIPNFGPALGGVIDGLYAHQGFVWVMLGLFGLGALGLVFGVATRLSTAIMLIGFLLLEFRNNWLPDGGDNIMRIALFYMLFLMPSTDKYRPGSLRVWVHNLAFRAIFAQVLILYIVAGVSKLSGFTWTHGTALYVISQVEWFSTPWFREVFKLPLITFAATYATIAYQISFPIGVFTRWRLVWLGGGILFHLGILVMMGLVTFSSVMIALELCLVTDEEYARIARFLTSVFERGRSRIAATPRGDAA
jgi:hypothetical protein